MHVKEKSRREIEEKLKTLGAFVKIDYLTSCLKQPIDFDTRRFALLKLAELYEEKKMFFEAGRMMHNAAPINTTIMEKISDYVYAGELFLKSGNFEHADIAFERAIGACETEQQRTNVKDKKINFYKQQAKSYLDNEKRQSAALAYEKLLSFNLASNEKKEAQETLLELYQKLGKIKEFYSLKRTM